MSNAKQKRAIFLTKKIEIYCLMPPKNQADGFCNIWRLPNAGQVNRTKTTI
jgi:hypothetical protein